MRTSGKRGSQGKPEVLTDGGKELPSRKALMALSKSKKTVNDYSKAVPSITDNGPSIEEK